jgi:hypothetical protein
MQLKSVSTGEATITAPTEELLFLCNAINEACELRDPEFKTRMGVTREWAEDIWKQLDGVLEEILRHEGRLK